MNLTELKNLISEFPELEYRKEERNYIETVHVAYVNGLELFTYKSVDKMIWMPNEVQIRYSNRYKETNYIKFADYNYMSNPKYIKPHLEMLIKQANDIQMLIKKFNNYEQEIEIKKDF